MHDKNVWEILLQWVYPPSDEAMAIARRLNMIADQVHVSDHGSVTVSTSTILQNAELARACEAAKAAISRLN
ncbi:hypothetical protein [Pseudomonas putida]|uniref:Uncharacterized protein n=1 Tax=Pseudomonas putida TaxID=303 RepID=A0A2S3W8G8_PSEPU|nr:hypothetical protein [Pseudomonas putida]POF87234.1 hypothetical protein BGP80_04380 [Pseudomonas putida]